MYGGFTYCISFYFGSMEEDEGCEYDHTLIDDSSAQGGMTRKIVMLEKTIQTCARMWLNRDGIDAVIG